MADPNGIPADDKTDVSSIAEVIEIVPLDRADYDFCCQAVEAKLDNLPVAAVEDPDVICPVLVVREEELEDVKVDSDAQDAYHSHFCGIPDFICPPVDEKQKDVQDKRVDENDVEDTNNSDLYCTPEFICPVVEVEDVKLGTVDEIDVESPDNSVKVRVYGTYSLMIRKYNA